MFYIHTLNGDHYDISLESLLHRKEVRSTGKKSPVRKYLRGENEKEISNGGGYALTYAEKSYRESADIKKEPEPVFHAYQIMSSPVKTVPPEMKVTDAWEYFKKSEVSHMPVVSGDGLIVGIISDRDLLKRLIISEDNVVNRTDETVLDVMNKEVITAAGKTDIRKIARVMFKEHIGCMPIIHEENGLAGIITRSDILHAIIHYPPLNLWG
ncbi:MAG TPA: CBS domain-containing protein [Spirochaetota bacterium]|nr:CBS domain-containing protein [Spirochaetota bacterium]HPJ36361.1 CBS domain-containing protein [Spirochaetota bacterium]